MSFTRRIDIDLDYEAAVNATKSALQEQGFGTLTEIDVRQTLQEKLGVETEPQVIIGACNPQLAHRALQIDPRVATLLPCNVVVRVEAGRTVVEALDPTTMADMSDSPEFARGRRRRRPPHRHRTRRSSARVTVAAGPIGLGDPAGRPSGPGLWTPLRPEIVRGAKRFARDLRVEGPGWRVQARSHRRRRSQVNEAPAASLRMPPLLLRPRLPPASGPNWDHPGRLKFMVGDPLAASSKAPGSGRGLNHQGPCPAVGDKGCS